MSSLADRLAAASRDRASSAAGPSDALPAKAADRPSAATRQEDEFRDLKATVHNRLLQQLGPKLYDAELTQSELERMVRSALQDAMQDEDVLLTPADRTRIAQEIADDILGYGPIEPFLRDPDLTEVMVNGPDSIWIERNGKLHKVEGSFTDEAHLRRTIDKIVSRIGRRVDESSPMVDARLPDGSRVNAIIPPLAVDGPLLSIRRFGATPLTVQNLLDYKSLTPPMIRVLEGLGTAKVNILISGGTGSGKTTLLNLISGFIPASERVVTIEDAAELQLRQPHVVRLETRPPNIEGKGEVTQRALVRNALRMRPDRIILGEVRGAEALDMLQAMNTGHEGSLATIHSNTPRDALSRLENMVSMAGVSLSARAIRQQIVSAVTVVVQVSRLTDGTRKVVSIQEITGMEGDIISMQEIFRFEQRGVDAEGRVLGHFCATGVRPRFADRLRLFGAPVPEDSFDPDRTFD